MIAPGTLGTLESNDICAKSHIHHRSFLPVAAPQVFTPWMREDTLRHHKDPPGYYNVNTAEIKFGGLLNGPALTRVNLQQPNLSLGRGAVGR